MKSLQATHKLLHQYCVCMHMYIDQDQVFNRFQGVGLLDE